MCDYSLESASRRDAAAGDQLKTAKIGVHGTVGLIAPSDPFTAVCLSPGSRLIASGLPLDFQRHWGVGEVVTGTFAKRDQHQTSSEIPQYVPYRDGIVFDGTAGSVVLFREFPLGIDISVEVIPHKVPTDVVIGAQREFVLD